jgi:iron complex outermembrane receptor protein
LFELYANGPHLAEGRYEIGDASLKAEHARNLDAGVRWRSSRVVAEVNAFRNTIADFIYITPTSEFNGGLRVYRHLQADALMTGGEVSAQAEVIPNVLLRARYDFVRGTNRETNDPLPLMPPPRAAFGAEYHYPSSANAFIGAEVENVVRQKRPNPSDVVTAGYTLLNVDAGIDYQLFGRATRVDIGVRNALNREYRSFLSRYKEFALEPGRNVVLRISTTP